LNNTIREARARSSVGIKIPKLVGDLTLVTYTDSAAGNGDNHMGCLVVLCESVVDKDGRRKGVLLKAFSRKPTRVAAASASFELLAMSIAACAAEYVRGLCVECGLTGASIIKSDAPAHPTPAAAHSRREPPAHPTPAAACGTLPYGYGKVLRLWQGSHVKGGEC